MTRIFNTGESIEFLVFILVSIGIAIWMIGLWGRLIADWLKRRKGSKPEGRSRRD